MSKESIETRQLYAASRVDGGAILTHAVVVTETGAVVRVICDRVQLASISDDRGDDSIPTCKQCARRLKTLKGTE